MQGHAGTAVLDDGAAYPAFDHHGVAGADEFSAVALVPVGVASGGVLAPQVAGQTLLVAEGPAYRCAVLVYVGLLLRAAAVWTEFQHSIGQANPQSTEGIPRRWSDER